MKIALSAVIFILGSTFACAAEKAFPLDDHTTALWNFDEGSGEVIEDEGPLKIPMAFHRSEGAPIPWDAGKFGSALHLEGRNRLVSRPNSPVISLGEEITVEAWIKLDPKTLKGRMGIIQNMAYRESGYRLEIKEERAVWMVEASGQEMQLSSNTPVPIGKWVLVAATYDGKSMRLYIDKELDAEKKAPGGTVSPNSEKLIIGYSDGDEEAYFQGWIDAIRVSDIIRKEVANP